MSASVLVDTLRKYNVEYVLLAGYLKLIPAELIHAYPKSILNIHPSLLPAFGGKRFYGMKVHGAVIASGARYSGPTIHFVDENFDTGRILAQRVVLVHMIWLLEFYNRIRVFNIVKFLPDIPITTLQHRSIVC